MNTLISILANDGLLRMRLGQDELARTFRDLPFDFEQEELDHVSKEIDSQMSTEVLATVGAGLSESEAVCAQIMFARMYLAKALLLKETIENSRH